jgi:hypothetical protein
MHDRTASIPLVGPRRRRAAALPLALAVVGAFGIGVAHANHTFGTLDCGGAGVFEVDGHLPQNSPIDRPVPWSGTFLLEGTTQVFHAYSNSHFGIVKNPASRDGLITCTLTSDGPMFDPPWTLVGKLAP